MSQLMKQSACNLYQNYVYMNLTSKTPLVFSKLYIVNRICIIKIINNLVLKSLMFMLNYLPTLLKQLSDIAIIHTPGHKRNLIVVYNIVSLTRNHRIFVTTDVLEASGITSVTNLYRSA